MLIFAHRGAAATRRAENTAAAFAGALQHGCAIETDARVSRSGDVVLTHDARRRLGVLRRAVRRVSTERLGAAGVLTIEQLYGRLGSHFELSIDLKDPAAGPGLIAAAERVDATARLWLVADDLDLLRRLRDTSSGIRLVHEARRRAVPDAVAHAALLADSGIDAQNTDVLDWDEQSVRGSQRLGVLAFGSLANDTDRFERAAALGIDAFYTDRLDLADRFGARLGPSPERRDYGRPG